MNQEKTVRNVTIDYIFSFIRNFDISSAIWVLYMVHKGLLLWQIGIVEGIFHIASFLFEVPSGAMADLYGRKRVMVLGRICSTISAIILLSSNTFYQFVIGFIFSALSYNLNSGSEEALVYDSLKVERQEEWYLKVNSRLNIIVEVSQGLGTFVGGVLAEYSYAYCYLTIIFLSVISLIPCLLLQEPEVIVEEKAERVSLKEHFILCVHILKENRNVLNILLYYPIVFTFDTVVYFYGQQYFNLMGCDKIQISLIMLGSSLFGCIGAISCEKLVNRLKSKTKYVASLLMAASIVAISCNTIGVCIGAFCVMSFANSVLYPIQSSSLNEAIPSKQRATIISVDSMIFSLAMICLFPLCGLLADICNLHLAFLLLGCLQLLFISLLIQRKKTVNDK